jgi:uncharacterized protein (DUF58 family)
MSTAAGRERTSARPTVFGLAVLVVLVVGMVVRPPVADPSVTGLVWAGLLGAVVLGGVWPLITVRTLGVTVTDAPTDLVVGQLGTLELELTGRASGLAIGATGSGTAVIDVVAPGRIRIPFSVARRGAYQQVQLDVASDAPFGIVQARRTRRVRVPHQLLVGPVAEDLVVQPGELPAELSEPVPSGTGTSGDSVRSVRPYVTGDPAHLVHWPSTARTGSLVVRELEPPAARGLAIVVDLGDGGVADDRVEQVAALAAGAAADAHRRGARVLLCTVEPSGAVLAEAPDVLSVQRRLALAVPGPVPAAPVGWSQLRLSPSDPAPDAGDVA